MTEAEIQSLIANMPDTRTRARNQQQLTQDTRGTYETAGESLTPQKTLQTKRGHKYGVAPVEERTFAGIVFDSKAEMDRWQFLLSLEQANKIHHLQRQHPFPFEVNDGGPIFTLTIDFAYFEGASWICEDVKGMASTPVFRLKKRLIEAKNGIRIREVRKDYKTGGWIIK